MLWTIAMVHNSWSSFFLWFKQKEIVASINATLHFEINLLGISKTCPKATVVNRLLGFLRPVVHVNIVAMLGLFVMNQNNTRYIYTLVPVEWKRIEVLALFMISESWTVFLAVTLNGTTIMFIVVYAQSTSYWLRKLSER
ncbi:unnamed protein product [Allacma fusca]|uniref:Uncharacterized protein n=1 Tax=Allacma fusca TaxID=39272 RepID=A0A8J2PQ04_9HEXA|nr:unnamed protein product [Allacma fusca]